MVPKDTFSLQHITTPTISFACGDTTFKNITIKFSFLSYSAKARVPIQRVKY